MPIDDPHKPFSHMTMDEKLADLEKRCLEFQTLSLPGQMPLMHMGTGYLVSDLADTVRELSADRTKTVSLIKAFVLLVRNEATPVRKRFADAMSVARNILGK